MSFLPFHIPLPILIEVGKKIWKWINDDGDDTQVTAKSSVEDWEKASESLDTIRSEIYKTFDPILADGDKAMDSFISDMHFQLNNYEELLENNPYAKRSINRILDEELKDSVSRFWKDKLRYYFSFDNPECRNMLKTPAGDRKTRLKKEMAQKAMEEIGQSYAIEIHRKLDTLNMEFADLVALSEGQIQRQIKQYDSLLFSLGKEASEQSEENLMDPCIKLHLCDELKKISAAEI